MIRPDHASRAACPTLHLRLCPIDIASKGSLLQNPLIQFLKCHASSNVRLCCSNRRSEERRTVLTLQCEARFLPILHPFDSPFVISHSFREIGEGPVTLKLFVISLTAPQLTAIPSDRKAVICLSSVGLSAHLNFLVRNP
jgi:hypothetical protein